MKKDELVPWIEQGFPESESDVIATTDQDSMRTCEHAILIGYVPGICGEGCGEGCGGGGKKKEKKRETELVPWIEQGLPEIVMIR